MQYKGPSWCETKQRAWSALVSPFFPDATHSVDPSWCLRTHWKFGKKPRSARHSHCIGQRSKPAITKSGGKFYFHMAVFVNSTDAGWKLLSVFPLYKTVNKNSNRFIFCWVWVYHYIAKRALGNQIMLSYNNKEWMMQLNTFNKYFPPTKRFL